MTKLRQQRLRRYTRVTHQLYRERVYRLVQDVVGYGEPPEQPEYKRFAEEFSEQHPQAGGEELLLAWEEAVEQWEQQVERPEAVLSEPYLLEATYAELRRSGVPPSGQTRGVLRKKIAQQHRSRRRTGTYEPLPVREHNGEVLVMLDWLHANIVDPQPENPHLALMVQDPHQFLRQANAWLHGALKGHGQHKLRMGGTKQFIHPLGEGGKIMDRELQRADRPEWLKRMQEQALQD